MDIDIKKIEQLVTVVLSEMNLLEKKQIPVGISNRHVHLCQRDLEKLFGCNYNLQPFKQLSQPGQFAAKETVELQGPKGKISKVRILGPARAYTQVEISRSDSFLLGVAPPVRESGDLSGTPGLILRGPQDEISLTQGVIIALRHIHIPIAYGQKYHYLDGQTVSVKVDSGERKVTFHDVKLRVSEQSALEMHVDIEEANAAGLTNQSFIQILSEE